MLRWSCGVPFREYAETLRGVLNTGYRRGGKTTVCVGQSSDITTRDFSTFGAKAIAGIGDLPDTVESRSIPIRLKRRAAGETVERFKRKVADGQAADLRDRATVWAAQHLKALADADPGSLSELGDRADEVWEPLRAIGDLAGGEWPALARAAAIELSGQVEGDSAPSNGVAALAAIRVAIGDRSSIATAEVLTRINANEDLPFGAWRKGDGLDSRGLARLLRPYGIKSGTVRVDDATPKGYSRSALEDAWARYLAPSLESPPQAPQAPHTLDPPHEKPREHRDVADVADVADIRGMGDRERNNNRHHAATALPAPDPTGDDLVALIVREFDAIELTDDCTDPLAHAREHRPHPSTRRTVCTFCHPPAEMLLNGTRGAI